MNGNLVCLVRPPQEETLPIHVKAQTVKISLAILATSVCPSVSPARTERGVRVIKSKDLSH
jgi:hypothetical protein